MAPDSRPHVVIVGGGFAGLHAARALARAPVRVTLVDRRNHHLFQPLLYQVATAALSPSQIAAPIRAVLSRQRNAQVMLAHAVGLDPERRLLRLSDGELSYDRLILAAGATHSYFGRDDWARAAPGLKTVEDGLEIRRRILTAFERAERETDAQRRRALLTFVVIGAGPTGVELSGAIAEIATGVLRRDFHRIDTARTRVVLVEAQDRVLPAFPPDCSAMALNDLHALGVEVLLGRRVTELGPHEVRVGDERIDAGTVVWAAGVAASPLGAALGVPLDRAGRVIVNPDLSVPGRPEIFVIGDQAAVAGPDGTPVPGVAPAAIQMGRFVGNLLARQAQRPDAPRPAFVYRDKGMLATIGRARAVAFIFGTSFGGLPAWLLWAGVHIMGLIGFRNRLVVLLDWLWAYVAFKHGSRIITTGADTPNQPPPA